MLKQSKKVLIPLVILATVVFTWWLFCLPEKLFDDPVSTVLNDRDNQLLNARIAEDGQWRFPESDSIPEKFEKCLLEFEDHRFQNHPGVDFRAIARAIQQNWEAGKIASGASTITMQLMRMSRKNRKRSWWNKLIETAMATRAEFRHSKEELLRMYASHAPFGGNVVGLDAATWRYFSKPAHSLTWAEAAVLAVLPNAPGLIYPGRSQEALKSKRDNLLHRLKENGTIDEETYRLSLLEPLPGTPIPLPNRAPHLLNFSATTTQVENAIQSTIDGSLQDDCNRLLNRHMEMLSYNHVRNGAILVADVNTGEVLVYAGNVLNGSGNFGEANDMIRTPRSSGSALKPFLYGMMLQRGIMTPRQLVADIPTQYSGFAPKNFDEQFAGAVYANDALSQSLNIPAVRMLRSYGIPTFHQDLKQMGFTSVNRHAGHYGLSLILGGAETTLWELVRGYRVMGAQLNHQPGLNSGLNVGFDTQEPEMNWPMETGAVWATAEAITAGNRPREDAQWRAFADAQKIAWKTGTSYGFRDAWAVGFNKNYVVGIWVGNANGAGRPGLTGLNAAAPLLFEVFNMLPRSEWFEKPVGELRAVEICRNSGMRASEKCGLLVTEEIPVSSLPAQKCHYCRFLHLDKSGKYRVNSQCANPAEINRVSQFVLPPLQEWYYKRNHANYQTTPLWFAGCNPDWNESPMHLIYPRDASRIFIPRELHGEKEKIVLKAAHRNPNSRLFWHLDDEYLGETSVHHHMEIQTLPGKFPLTLVDEDGYTLETVIEVVDR